MDYAPLYQLTIAGAPSFNQKGIFIVTSPNYKPTQVWNIAVLASRLTGQTAVSKMYKRFKADYLFPASLVINPIKRVEVQHSGVLDIIWKQHLASSIWYILLWLTTIGIFVFRRRISQTKWMLETIHNSILAISIITIGIYQHNQPSVVNIFTLAGVIVADHSFKIFLMDPYLAIGWVMIAVTTIIWGRSLFCGWLCPFGAIQELIFKVRTKFTPYKKSLELKNAQHLQLRYVRYIIFILLFIISLYSLKIAELLAEIEPFKTTWNIGILNRPFGYGLYVIFLLVFASITYRFFCRYICPLGAGLSLLSFFPFKPLPRRNACVSCKLCSNDCEPKAINVKGEINPAECLACFTCLNKMYDKKVCPPLKRKKIWNKFNEKPQ